MTPRWSSSERRHKRKCRIVGTLAGVVGLLVVLTSSGDAGLGAHQRDAQPFTHHVSLSPPASAPSPTLPSDPPLSLITETTSLPLRLQVSPNLVRTYGRLPLSFEENQGQVDSQVEFLSRGRGYTLFLTPTAAVLSLRSSAREPIHPLSPVPGGRGQG